MKELLESINEFNKFTEESSLAFNILMERADALADGLNREYKINTSEAKLKVMIESGNDDDFSQLMFEAGKDMKEKMVSTIIKIKEAVINFFKKIKEKIVNTICSAKNLKKVKEVQDVINADPELKNKKINIIDIGAADKDFTEVLSKFSRIEAKAASGQDVDTKEIENIKSNFIKKHKTGLIISSTLASAVAVISLGLYKAKKVADKNEQAILDTIKDSLDTLKDKAGNAKVYIALAQAKAAVGTTLQSLHNRFLSNGLSKIVDAIRSKKNAVTGRTVLDKDVALSALGESIDNVEYGNNYFEKMMETINQM